MKTHKGVRSVGNLIEEITNPTFKKNGFINQKLINGWSYIVGSHISKVALPLKIVFEKNQTRNGILYVNVFNPAMSVEITFQESRIIEKISQFFGYQAISKIKIVVHKGRNIANSNSKKPKEKEVIDQKFSKDIDNAIDEITSEELKTVLNSLKNEIFEEK